MEKIAEIIHQKYPQFNTIRSTRSVSDALYQMRCENIDYLIVQDEAENFIGLLTEHDVASKVLLSNKELDALQIGDFVTTTLPVATMEDSLEYALQLLENHNSRYLAVYDQFTFKGILSVNDLLKMVLIRRKNIFDEVQRQNTGYPWTY